MACRRMFSRDFVESDAFLDLPLQSQLLYFHLSLNADDDGMISNSRTIIRMVGCCDDDLQTLIEKKFVFRFDSGVCGICHWRLNNYIRSDRYKETIFKKEKAMMCENCGVYEMSTTGIPNDNQRLTQNSIDKISIDKYKETRAREPCKNDLARSDDTDFEKLWDYTFSVYPKKSGAATAKEEWMKKLVPVLPDNRFAVAKLIYEAEKAYLDDYLIHHPAEPESEKFRFVPNFARWLSEDADFWIKCVEEKEKKEQKQGDG